MVSLHSSRKVTKTLPIMGLMSSLSPMNPRCHSFCFSNRRQHTLPSSLRKRTKVQTEAAPSQAGDCPRRPLLQKTGMDPS